MRGPDPASTDLVVESRCCERVREKEHIEVFHSSSFFAGCYCCHLRPRRSSWLSEESDPEKKHFKNSGDGRTLSNCSKRLLQSPEGEGKPIAVEEEIGDARTKIRQRIPLSKQLERYYEMEMKLTKQADRTRLRVPNLPLVGGPL